jgi:nitroimidazol reductase NimA-like FMN-containing flavoprotein (pyridoxamine 5'-phosphate oxidase superfamily)
VETGAAHRAPSRSDRASMKVQPVTFEPVLAHLRNIHFVVISTSDDQGTPHSAGVNYGVTRPDRELAIYVMTRQHLRKARNITQNPNVSLVVPLPRRLLVSAASDDPVAWPSRDR